MVGAAGRRGTVGFGPRAAPPAPAPAARFDPFCRWNRAPRPFSRWNRAPGAISHRQSHQRAMIHRQNPRQTSGAAGGVVNRR
jgi:hypothetical protein